MHELVRRAKKHLLQMHFDAGVGHIGGNLSALDCMLVLRHQVMPVAIAIYFIPRYAALMTAAIYARVLEPDLAPPVCRVMLCWGTREFSRLPQHIDRVA
jgi:hypothetical protein